MLKNEVKESQSINSKISQDKYKIQNQHLSALEELERSVSIEKDEVAVLKIAIMSKESEIITLKKPLREAKSR